MDVLQAIEARHSVREFAATPVPRETIMAIMAAAMRSPSGGNGQPWEIFVAAGATLERIRTVYAERAAQAGPPPMPGGVGGPPPAPAFIQERMATIRRERMELLGLDPADPASGRVFMQWGARMFGAPAVAIICMHEALSSYLDIGLLVQTICLAAQGLGVDSMIAGALVAHQDVLRAELGIPDQLKIVTGIGLGYADPASKINTYRSPRRPVEEVVRYRA